MSIVLYVGGSKDGDKGVVPYGLSKAVALGTSGREVYVARDLAVEQVGRVRVMALESLSEGLLMQRVACHYRS